MQNRIRVLLINTVDDTVKECFALLALADQQIVMRFADGRQASKPWRDSWADQPLMDSAGCVVPGVRIVA